MALNLAGIPTQFIHPYTVQASVWLWNTGITPALINNSYIMQVKFNRCTSKELRETLVKYELMNRFPLTRNRTIYIEEFLGKLYKMNIDIE